MLAMQIDVDGGNRSKSNVGRDIPAPKMLGISHRVGHRLADRPQAIDLLL